jgi:hypothetical protein
MLRLKQAIDDCKIQQKSVVEATGFGKTQVSLTLKTGCLPADAKKFMDGVYQLISESQLLCDWLSKNQLAANQLFDAVEGGRDVACNVSTEAPQERLGNMVATIAGRACIDPELICPEDIVRLARTATYLTLQLTYHAGFAAPEILREAAAILLGGTP